MGIFAECLPSEKFKGVLYRIWGANSALLAMILTAMQHKGLRCDSAPGRMVSGGKSSEKHISMCQDAVKDTGADLVIKQDGNPLSNNSRKLGRKKINGPILSPSSLQHTTPLTEHALYAMVVCVWPDNPEEVSKNILRPLHFCIYLPVGCLDSNGYSLTHTSYLVGICLREREIGSWHWPLPLPHTTPQLDLVPTPILFRTTIATTLPVMARCLGAASACAGPPAICTSRSKVHNCGVALLEMGLTLMNHKVHQRKPNIGLGCKRIETFLYMTPSKVVDQSRYCSGL